MPELIDKYRGCVVGLAVADALGRKIEFAHSAEEITKIAGERGVEDMSSDGKFTDDTQMACCVAEALIESDTKFDKFMESFSKYLIAWYKSQEDPAFNRAPEIGCMGACERLNMGVNWFEAGMAEGTMSNAPVVRSAPIGLYLNQIPKIVEFGIGSSQITHLDTACQCGAVASAMVTMLALQDVPVGVWAHELMLPISGIEPMFDECVAYGANMATTRIHPFQALTNDYVGEGWFATDAIAGAIFCCMRQPTSYKEAVLMAVNTIGDSDSLGCIVGAWMGARHGLAAIPPQWVSKVEDSAELIKLADRLYESRQK